MTDRIRRWLNTRTGRLAQHDVTVAVAAGIVAWQAAGSDWTWGAWTAAGVIALKTLLRLLLPIPAGRRNRPKVPRATAGSHTVVVRRILEFPVEGKPLGRYVRHDSRSLDYLVPKMSRRAQRRMTPVRWVRRTPTLNQLKVGSCTGNATVGYLGTVPAFATLAGMIASGLRLDETEALSIYSDAEKLDGGVGYPPEDVGSSGLSVAKVAKARGLISGYTHITSIAAAKTAISTGPFITGTNWWSGMDLPDASGLVHVTGYVRGAHEYEGVGYDPVTDLWEFINSWGQWGATVDGQPGHFYMSGADYAKLLAADGDATVLKPIAAAPTPAPTGGVTVVDSAVVAKVDSLAAKQHEDPATYLTNRLKSLWNL